MEAEGRQADFDRRIHPRQSEGCFVSLIGDLPTNPFFPELVSVGVLHSLRAPSNGVAILVAIHPEQYRFRTKVAQSHNPDVVANTSCRPSTRGAQQLPFSWFSLECRRLLHSWRLPTPHAYRAEFNTGDHQNRLGEPSYRPDHRAEGYDLQVKPMALILGLTEWTHLTLGLASYKTFAVVRHVID